MRSPVEAAIAMSMRRCVAVLVLLLATLWVPSVGADTNLAEARRLFRAGARAYDAGQFQAAVRAFDQAYELSPKPALRFSAAQALRRQYTVDQDPVLLRKAEAYYRQYVANTLDVEEYLAFQLEVLTMHSRERLNEWRSEFIQDWIAPRVAAASLELVWNSKNASE